MPSSKVRPERAVWFKVKNHWSFLPSDQQEGLMKVGGATVIPPEARVDLADWR